MRILLDEGLQSLVEAPQSVHGLIVGPCDRVGDLPHLLWCQQIHACAQASGELLGISDALLLPFPVELGQHRFAGRFRLGRALRLSIGALPRSGVLRCLWLHLC